MPKKQQPREHRVSFYNFWAILSGLDVWPGDIVIVKDDPNAYGDYAYRYTGLCELEDY